MAYVAKRQQRATTNLGEVLRRWRLVEDLDLRTASQRIGISAATLMRIEQGRQLRQETFLTLLTWFGQRTEGRAG